MRASETLSAEQAAERLDGDSKWITAILARLQPYIATDANQPLRILDIGAAQGRVVAAMLRLGHEAVGVEPHGPAVEQSKLLGDKLGLAIDVRQGSMEEIPFPDESFDVVIAMSVVEHVTDVQQSFREARRVLRPGGVFWFDTASAMCPKQAEIAHVPLFGWYPLPLKRLIMRWAQRNRPGWIGHTSVPAMHWFTPRSANRRLKGAGFVDVFDRWTLRLPSENAGLGAKFVHLARRNAAARFVGNVLVTGCSYLARK